MMAVLGWLTGVGLPTLVGFALLGAAAVAWVRIPFFGHYFGLVLACVGSLILGNAKGFSDCLDSSKVNALRAELANAKRDLAITAEAAANAADISRKLTEAERKNDDLARKVTGSCLLTPRDVDGLRRIQ
jgi:hypothetical protein